MQRTQREKFEFIEGARGIAAAQVVLLHCCSLFLPLFARAPGPEHYRWEVQFFHTPLFFLIDGYTAVYIFFLMSGFVLAPSFVDSKIHFSQQVAKRFFRLYVPVAASIVLSLALSLAFRGASAKAAALSGSQWAASLFANPLTWSSVVKDLLASSMVLGYHGASIFTPFSFLAGHLSLQSDSMNPPLWTIHLEFWGSMLLLATARLYRWIPRRMFTVALCVAIVLLWRSPFSLFLLGFGIYLMRSRFLAHESRFIDLVGMACLLAGVFSSAIFDFGKHRQVTAIALFVGVLLSRPARNVLSKVVPLWLGKVSYSLYLVHFPILFTLGSALFVFLSSVTSYAAATALATIATSAMALLTARWFERYVDKPAVSFARRLAVRPKIAEETVEA
jgi:peptidoglycan/LPS O-acetylase OafA/YrhL